MAAAASRARTRGRILADGGDDGGMEPRNGSVQVVPERPRRIWVLLFAVAGLPAMFSAMVLPFNVVLALPWVAVSWPIAALAGYRIWRARNPTADPRTALAVRARLVGGIVATTVATLFVVTFPQLATLIVGIYVAVIVLAYLLLALSSRGRSK
jgi:hypothetical protein